MPAPRNLVKVRVHRCQDCWSQQCAFYGCPCSCHGDPKIALFEYEEVR